MSHIFRSESMVYSLLGACTPMTLIGRLMFSHHMEWVLDNYKLCGDAELESHNLLI